MGAGATQVLAGLDDSSRHVGFCFLAPGARVVLLLTAISKPQIESLLHKKVFPMELFDTNVSEVASIPEKVRYILRRNPQRALEIQQSRQSKQNSLANFLQEKNNYLAKKPKARVKVALKAARARAAKLKIDDWLSVKSQGRKLVLTLDEPALAEAKKLDGCYVIKTDLLGDWTRPERYIR